MLQAIGRMLLKFSGHPIGVCLLHLRGGCSRTFCSEEPTETTVRHFFLFSNNFFVQNNTRAVNAVISAKVGLDSCGLNALNSYVTLSYNLFQWFEVDICVDVCWHHLRNPKPEARTLQGKREPPDQAPMRRATTSETFSWHTMSLVRFRHGGLCVVFTNNAPRVCEPTKSQVRRSSLNCFPIPTPTKS